MLIPRRSEMATGIETETEIETKIEIGIASLGGRRNVHWQRPLDGTRRRRRPEGIRKRIPHDCKKEGLRKRIRLCENEDRSKSKRLEALLSA